MFGWFKKKTEIKQPLRPITVGEVKAKLDLLDQTLLLGICDDTNWAMNHADLPNRVDVELVHPLRRAVPGDDSYIEGIDNMTPNHEISFLRIRVGSYSQVLVGYESYSGGDREPQKRVTVAELRAMIDPYDDDVMVLSNVTSSSACRPALYHRIETAPVFEYIEEGEIGYVENANNRRPSGERAIVDFRFEKYRER